MKLYSIQEVHQSLIQNPNQGFFQNFNGNINSLENLEWLLKERDLYILCGSFNPLHETHKIIYDNMVLDFNNSFFELSINRFDKEELSAEDLEKRLFQFIGYGEVIITNLPTFIEKAGLLSYKNNHIEFHVGADTLKRLMYHQSFLGIQGMKCDFCYYDRIMDDKKIEMSKLPNNCFKSYYELSEDNMKLSSTMIRNKSLNAIA